MLVIYGQGQQLFLNWCMLFVSYVVHADSYAVLQGFPHLTVLSLSEQPKLLISYRMLSSRAKTTDWVRLEVGSTTCSTPRHSWHGEKRYQTAYVLNVVTIDCYLTQNSNFFTKSMYLLTWTVGCCATRWGYSHWPKSTHCNTPGMHFELSLLKK